VNFFLSYVTCMLIVTPCSRPHDAFCLSVCPSVCLSVSLGLYFCLRAAVANHTAAGQLQTMNQSSLCLFYCLRLNLSVTGRRAACMSAFVADIFACLFLVRTFLLLQFPLVSSLQP